MQLNLEKTAVVACGTLRPELTKLAEEGFVDEKKHVMKEPTLKEDSSSPT